MRHEHMRGVSRRRSFCVTTERDVRHRPAPDLVNREFVATDINQLWVADMTYIPTWTGFLYLAMVIDVYSRKVVGWAFGERMTSDLVILALNMALMTRKPQSVIHHSDQGSQYTSIAFGNRCKEMGVRPSMGTVGDAYDNAMAESFFASLECELIAPGFVEAGWFKSGHHRGGLLGKLPIVVCLSFCRRDTPDRREQSDVVEPVHPLQGRQFHGFPGLPGAPAMNQFGLV